MTRIEELARRLAAAKRTLEYHGVMNMADTPEKQVMQSAQYRLAVDALRRAKKEYDDAINALPTDELFRLAGVKL
jgi:hypothetical protein